MLPTVKNTTLTALTALSLALTAAAPAHAWGQREQDVLKGVVGTVVVGSVLRQYGILQPQPRPVYRQPVYQEPPVVYTQPRYVAPQPVYVQRPTYTTSVYQTPAAYAFNSYSTTERRAIQRRLAAAGYYYGGIDGAFGPGTYSAISAYAADRGLSGKLASREGAYGVYDGLIF